MLRIDNISFSYDGDRNVIENFSAEFKKGEVVCISAPSGKGKTTLLRIICNLEKIDKGLVQLDDDYRIGMVFQNDVLLPWKNTLENVSVVSSKEQAMLWLDRFRLADSTEKYPSELSGGMCRRVAIARACAYNPDILILDEAFKGLDEELKTSIMNIIKKEFSSKLIIFTSHDENEIKQFATRRINL